MLLTFYDQTIGAVSGAKQGGIMGGALGLAGGEGRLSMRYKYSCQFAHFYINVLIFPFIWIGAVAGAIGGAAIAVGGAIQGVTQIGELHVVKYNV